MEGNTRKDPFLPFVGKRGEGRTKGQSYGLLQVRPAALRAQVCFPLSPARPLVHSPRPGRSTSAWRAPDGSSGDECCSLTSRTVWSAASLSSTWSVCGGLSASSGSSASADWLCGAMASASVYGGSSASTWWPACAAWLCGTTVSVSVSGSPDDARCCASGPRTVSGCGSSDCGLCTVSSRSSWCQLGGWLAPKEHLAPSRRYHLAEIRRIGAFVHIQRALQHNPVLAGHRVD